jgi:hypothetical protein
MNEAAPFLILAVTIIAVCLVAIKYPPNLNP